MEKNTQSFKGTNDKSEARRLHINARNQVVFNKTVFNPIEVATKAADFIQELNKENKSVAKSPHPQSFEPWEPPLQSYTKINVDAGCFPNEYTGWGMIACSCKEVIYTATKLDNLHMSPSLAEAVGIRWCLQWVKNNQMVRIIVESDAEVVVNCINGTTKLAVIDHVVLDCKEMLAQMEHVSVVSVRGSKNMAAHGLVQVARDLGSRTWVGNVPAQIYQTVCKDSLFSVQ